MCASQKKKKKNRNWNIYDRFPAIRYIRAKIKKKPENLSLFSEVK